MLVPCMSLLTRQPRSQKIKLFDLVCFKPRVRLGQKTATRTKYQIHTEFTMLNSRYVGFLHLTILKITYPKNKII
jgi:hypothetical protein